MSVDLESLAQRLADMENRDAERLAMEEQKGFIDKYGTMFSGDEGIGMAILAEMNRRGVPAAEVGADRVVQEILDAIRQEATMILDKIKSDGAMVADLMDQVQEIQESVDAAVGSGEGVIPPPVDTMPPVEETALPPEMPPVEEVPLSQEAIPSEAEVLPPPPPPVEEVPALPPEQQLSDQRTKRIIKLNRKPAKNSWKPGSHLLSAAQGGK